MDKATRMLTLQEAVNALEAAAKAVEAEADEYDAWDDESDWDPPMEYEPEQWRCRANALREARDIVGSLTGRAQEHPRAEQEGGAVATFTREDIRQWMMEASEGGMDTTSLRLLVLCQAILDSGAGMTCEVCQMPMSSCEAVFCSTCMAGVAGETR